MKKPITLFIISFLSASLFAQDISSTNDTSLYSGFRASRILSSYPNNQFPHPAYWQKVGDQMSEKFENAQPAGIWIVSLYQENGYTRLNFPSPGGNFNHIWFSNEDQNEEWLSYFDEHGLKVWLQVESGAADIDTLMQLIFDRYQQHACIIGFGVDVEWYQAQDYSEGKPVTDEEAETWENAVKSYNPDFTLFLKHYHPGWMPPQYRGDILFVDDSQDFTWASNPLNAMVNEFSVWASAFSPNPSCFQFGYPADETWWSQLDDPPKDIGQDLIDNIPECKGIFWVDFTITQIFPVTGVSEKKELKINLFNYPNPFHNKTSFVLQTDSKIKGHFEIFDIQGNLLIETPERIFTKGRYEIPFYNSNLSQGTYYYRFVSNGFTETCKFCRF
ncbi:MAG: hypothetical protein B6D61_09895 [Bacteroidetes bacterium 4484_249]|nr:MAG: hypothetical protein B6D61_09895 [Bacteroidetes bacterium 4484_249]